MSSPSKKQPARASSGSVWKTFALLLIVLNVALAAAWFSTRPGAAGGNEKVVQLIDRYFRTWSEADMDGYRDCFHPFASIHYVNPSGVPKAQNVAPFVEEQRGVHERTDVPLREVPLTKEILVDGDVARVLVRWKLFRGSEESEGTDYFTLINTQTGWKIISLVWNNET